MNHSSCGLTSFQTDHHRFKSRRSTPCIEMRVVVVEDAVSCVSMKFWVYSDWMGSVSAVALCRLRRQTTRTWFIVLPNNFYGCALDLAFQPFLEPASFVSLGGVIEIQVDFSSHFLWILPELESLTDMRHHLCKCLPLVRRIGAYTAAQMSIWKLNTDIWRNAEVDLALSFWKL